MADRALERLANSVLWPGFLAPRLPAWVEREREAGLAGVVLFSQNVGSGPVDGSGGFLVGIDEEGGSVTRVDAAGGSPLPGAMQLGAVDDVAATRRVARMLAERAAGVGANVVIAPVADVNANAANPVIGTRSFGADPALVARHVAAAVAGIADGGAVAVPKHFPGHGDTAVDSHHGLAVSGTDAQTQERVHLEPFRAAIEAGARMIMTAHLVVPGWGEEEPATLNPAALGRLRALGFEGVIVSDALDMAAVKRRHGTPAAAVRALVAGCDLLCISNPANPGSSGDDEADFLAVRDAIVAAAGSGELPLERLEEAAARVEALRAAMRTAAPGGPAPEPNGAPGFSSVAESSAAPGFSSVAGSSGAPGSSSGAGSSGAPGFPSVAERSGAAAEMKRPAQLDDNDAFCASLADTALRRDGSFAPLPGPRRVLDARAAATWAVSANGRAIAEIIAAGGSVEPWGDAVDVAAGDRPVLLADRLATDEQRAAVAAFARRAPEGVVVNLGVDPLPGAVPGDLPALHTRAASRLGAEVADRALAAGWAATA